MHGAAMGDGVRDAAGPAGPMEPVGQGGRAIRPALRWPLAGRARELDLCATVLADDRHDTLLICGPPGVGKSRLADEALRSAERSGTAVHRVTATRAAAAIPLGATAHVIPDGVDMANPVHGFRAVVAALRGTAGPDRPLILVDDLHLLDSASAVLLRQLLDARAVKVVATVRAGERNDPVDVMTAPPTTYRLNLERFDAAQLDAVVSAALQGPVSRGALTRFLYCSDGNALYLKELVLRALETGALTYDGELWELRASLVTTTRRLDDLILGRLAGVSTAERELLQLLAVCEPLPLADAEDVATTAGVIRLDEDSLIHVTEGAEVTLAHPLYGEALRSGISRLRARELLLAQIARTEARGARGRRDVLRLATWSLAATGTAAPELLVSAALVARHAHDYASVRSLLAATPADGRDHLTSLLLGHASMQLGQHADADVHLERAQRDARDDGELTAATLARTWNLLWMAGRAKDSRHVNEAAVPLLGSAETRRPLVLNEAALRAVSGEPVAGLAVLRTLEADFTREASPAAWSMAAMARTAGLAYTGRVLEAVEAGQHAYTADRRMAEDPDLAHQGTIPEGQLNPVILALTDAGEFRRARDTAERVLTAGAATDAALTWAWAAFFRARAEWLAGDLRAARIWYAEALAQARTNGYLPVATGARYGLAATAAVLLDFDAAEAALRDARRGPAMGHLAGEDRLADAWLEAAHGRVGPARDTLLEAAAVARASGHACSEALLLTDVARLGDPGAVAARLAELADCVQGAFTPARAAFAAALARQDPDGLLRSHEEFRTLGAHVLAAEAASAAAAALSRGAMTRRATSAARLARESAKLCPGVCTPLHVMSLAAPSLTAREREIAGLAVGGRPSKEIARDLHLSVRTVDNHLRRIYEKLGVTTRRELATVFS